MARINTYIKDTNNDISKHISYNIDCKVLIELNFFINEQNLKIFILSKSVNIIKY